MSSSSPTTVVEECASVTSLRICDRGTPRTSAADRSAKGKCAAEIMAGETKQIFTFFRHFNIGTIAVFKQYFYITIVRRMVLTITQNSAQKRNIRTKYGHRSVRDTRNQYGITSQISNFLARIFNFIAFQIVDE